MKTCQHVRFTVPLSLEQQIFLPDGGGGRDLQWQFISKVWAKIDTKGAKEVQRDGSQVMRTLHDITIRPRQIIDATMRFTYGARHFYITGHYLVMGQGSLPSASQVLKCQCEEFDSLWTP